MLIRMCANYAKKLYVISKNNSFTSTESFLYESGYYSILVLKEEESFYVKT